MRIKQIIAAILLLYSTPIFAQDDVVDEAVYNKSVFLADQGWKHLTGDDLEVSVEKFTASIAIYDGNADAFVGRANALMKLDRLAEAEKDVEQALSMSENEADMFYLAGNIYFKMQYYEKALNSYSQAIKFNDSSEVPVDLGNCYYNRGNANFEYGMYRSAINDFTKAINEKADFIGAYHNRGLAFKNRGMLEEACIDFNKAKSLGSNASDKYITEYCQNE